MNLNKKCTAKPYFLLDKDIALALDNSLLFLCNHLERIQILILISDDNIQDEKLQYDSNRKAAKVLALSSGEEILPSNQSIMIEQAKCT